MTDEELRGIEQWVSEADHYLDEELTWQFVEDTFRYVPALLADSRAKAAEIARLESWFRDIAEHAELTDNFLLSRKVRWALETDTHGGGTRNPA